MKKADTKEFQTFEMDSMIIETKSIITEKGHRVCDNCGYDKDIFGGKSCSKGHFICHSCASRHIHCPLCGHTLR